MLYVFKCQKDNCRTKFEEAMPLERYEKVKAMDPPFYEIRCPVCWTKAPVRSWDKEDAPAFHSDTGSWDPRSAPSALAGKSWTSKDEKERQVREVLGDGFAVGQVDRDMTVKPVNRQATRIKASEAKASKAPVNVRAAVEAAIKPGVPFRVAELAKQIGAKYRPVYAAVLKITGVEKVAPGEFLLVA